MSSIEAAPSADRFEDRLLGELTALVVDDPSRATAGMPAPGGHVDRRRRRRRRPAWVLGAAVAVAVTLAVVLPVGAPDVAAIPAYAVQRGGDGAVYVSVHDQSSIADPAIQQRLHRELLAAGVPNSVLVSTPDCPTTAERLAAADADGAVETTPVRLDGERVLQWVVHPNLLHSGEQIVIEVMLADGEWSHPRFAGFGMLPYRTPPTCIPTAHQANVPEAVPTK